MKLRLPLFIWFWRSTSVTNKQPCRLLHFSSECSGKKLKWYIISVPSCKVKWNNFCKSHVMKFHITDIWLNYEFNHGSIWTDHLLLSPEWVAQSCLTLCNPVDCSIPGFPVHHQLPELSLVHQISGTIQPSHPLSSASLPAFNLSQHQGLF